MVSDDNTCLQNEFCSIGGTWLALACPWRGPNNKQSTHHESHTNAQKPHISKPKTFRTILWRRRRCHSCRLRRLTCSLLLCRQQLLDLLLLCRKLLLHDSVLLHLSQ